MGVIDGVLQARTAAGYLETIFFAPNKVVAVIPKTNTTSLSSINPLNTNESASGTNVNADVIFNYNYSANIQLTENPVENGILVNDHRVIKPKIVKIEVGINNIIGIVDTLLNADKASLIQASKLLIFGNRFDAASRSVGKYIDFLNAMYNGNPFDLVTPQGVFKNMLITSIESTNDADTISVFKGTITYQELITFDVVTSRTKKLGAVLPTNVGVVKANDTASLIPSGLRF